VPASHAAVDFTEAKAMITAGPRGTFDDDLSPLSPSIQSLKAIPDKLDLLIGAAPTEPAG
jgi:hypothetical protein